MQRFVRERNRQVYLGVSWGKDSVVLAHLGADLGVPFIWVRVEPMYSPECLLVRDAFLLMHPGVRYEEIVVRCTRDKAGEWIGTGRLEQGFKQAVLMFGEHYISGVRGEESGDRKRRMLRSGTDTKRTCAPIGYWTGDDIFAAMHKHDLPIHPAYAMTIGGSLDRRRIRVATLGGERGTGWGRAEWERRYYGAEMRALRRLPGS